MATLYTIPIPQEKKLINRNINSIWAPQPEPSVQRWSIKWSLRKVYWFHAAGLHWVCWM